MTNEFVSPYIMSPTTYQRKYPNLTLSQIKSMCSRGKHKNGSDNRVCSRCDSPETRIRTRPNLVMVDGITPYAPFPEWYRDKANPGQWLCYWCAISNYAKVQREQRSSSNPNNKKQHKKKKNRREK